MKYLSSKPKVDQRQPILESRARNSDDRSSKNKTKNHEECKKKKKSNYKKSTQDLKNQALTSHLAHCCSYQKLFCTLLRAWEFLIIFVCFHFKYDLLFYLLVHLFNLLRISCCQVILASAVISETHWKQTVLLWLLKGKGALNILNVCFHAKWRPSYVVVLCVNWGLTIPKEKSQLKCQK